jgi:hypothetical protein
MLMTEAGEAGGGQGGGVLGGMPGFEAAEGGLRILEAGTWDGSMGWLDGSRSLPGKGLPPILTEGLGTGPAPTVTGVMVLARLHLAFVFPLPSFPALSCLYPLVVSSAPAAEPCCEGAILIM